MTDRILTEHRRQYLRDYSRRWIAARRAAFFKGKRCCICGSRTRLELDHKDPGTKVSHSIWSWSEKRRHEELKKCQVLCHRCHQVKSAAENKARQTGVPKLTLRKFTEQEAMQIRRESSMGMSERTLANKYGVAKTTIHDLRTQHYY